MRAGKNSSGNNAINIQNLCQMLHAACRCAICSMSMTYKDSKLLGGSHAQNNRWQHRITCTLCAGVPYVICPWHTKTANSWVGLMHRTGDGNTESHALCVPDQSSRGSY